MNKPTSRTIIVFAASVILFTSIPYLIGYFRQGSEWQFTGFVFGVEDGNSYIAKMLNGYYGDWLFRTPYTVYPQQGFLAYLPYLLLGKLAAPPGIHEQLVALFHLFRWLGGGLMIWATYDFVTLFVKDAWLRIFGTTIITIGGGLGWLAPLGLQSLWGGRLPLEFYSPETFGFLSIFGLPHLSIARAFLLWGLRNYLSENSSIINGAALWFLLGFFQPLTVVIGWTVLAAFLLTMRLYQWWQIARNPTFTKINWKIYLYRAGILLVCSSPMVVYTFISFSRDPFLVEWGKQNLIFSPPIGDYLLAFGLFLPFTIWGLINIFKRGDFPSFMLAGWFLISPLLAYAPYNLQRRLPDGVWTAIIVLAILGLEKLGSSKFRFIRSLWLTSFITPLMLLVGGILSAWSPQYPVFQSTAAVHAYSNLSIIAKPGSSILSDFESGNAMPAWSFVRTVIGHGPESIHFNYVDLKVREFFSCDSSLPSKISFLRELKLDYVFWGPAEEKNGNCSPVEGQYIEKIYDKDGYKIFRAKIH